ncbi:MAG: hypothetical protein ACI37J_05565 [Candidatus Bruticola sp.]
MELVSTPTRTFGKQLTDKHYLPKFSATQLFVAKLLKMSFGDRLLWGAFIGAACGLVFLLLSLGYYHFCSYTTCRENQRNLRAAIELYTKNDGHLLCPSSLDMLVPRYFFEIPQCSEGKYQYEAENNGSGQHFYRISCDYHGEIY